MAGPNNDPFEEFEFRPINEGLGFHRKQRTATTTNSGPITSATTTAAKHISSRTQKPATQKPPPSTSEAGLETYKRENQTIFNSPLPRSDSQNRVQIHVPRIEDDSISKAQTAVNDILKSLNEKRQIDFIQTTEKEKAKYKKSKPQLFASVLDGMLILSAFLMSLIVMLSITKVDLFMNLSHPQTSGMIYVATAALFFAIHFIYMVVNRAFLGYTPGEWAFDQVCGREEQSEELTYIPKLIFRTILVAATGFILMPFLSFLFNKDVAGQITGISLFQRPHA